MLNACENACRIVWLRICLTLVYIADHDDVENVPKIIHSHFTESECVGDQKSTGHTYKQTEYFERCI